MAARLTWSNPQPKDPLVNPVGLLAEVKGVYNNMREDTR